MYEQATFIYHSEKFRKLQLSQLVIDRIKLEIKLSFTQVHSHEKITCFNDILIL